MPSRNTTRGNRTHRGKIHDRGFRIIKSLRSTILIILDASMAYGFCRKWRGAVLRSPASKRMCSGAGMAHWQDRFLGIGELPPELSIFELEFFQFSPRAVAAIRKEFRPKYRIAVALFNSALYV
jgi:hypothetical protein